MFKKSFDIHNYVENNTHMFAVMLKVVLAYAQICVKHVQLCIVMLKMVLAVAHVLGFQGRIHRLSRMNVFCYCTL